MEDWKDGIISVEAEKIIPITKGEWKEFQKQMRMEGDYFYMVGNKKYVHYDGEDYLRMEDYRQELDKAREEGRKDIFTKEESRVIRWAFRNMEEQINTVWDEETYNQIEKKLEYYLN